MADVKISQLPNASALDGTEQIPAVQGGNTVNATIHQIKTKVIGGDVAFPNIPTIPTIDPTLDGHIASKGYVDAKDAQLRSDLSENTGKLTELAIEINGETKVNGGYYGYLNSDGKFVEDSGKFWKTSDYIYLESTDKLVSAMINRNVGSVDFPNLVVYNSKSDDSYVQKVAAQFAQGFEYIATENCFVRFYNSAENWDVITVESSKESIKENIGKMSNDINVLQTFDSDAEERFDEIQGIYHISSRDGDQVNLGSFKEGDHVVLTLIKSDGTNKIAGLLAQDGWNTHLTPPCFVEGEGNSVEYTFTRDYENVWLSTPTGYVTASVMLRNDKVISNIYKKELPLDKFTFIYNDNLGFSGCLYKNGTIAGSTTGGAWRNTDFIFLKEGASLITTLLSGFDDSTDFCAFCIYNSNKECIGYLNNGITDSSRINITKYTAEHDCYVRLSYRNDLQKLRITLVDDLVSMVDAIKYSVLAEKTSVIAGKKVVVLGTSISDFGNYTKPLVQLTNCDMTNLGIAGSTISDYNGGSNPLVNRLDTIPDGADVFIIEEGMNDQNTPLGDKNNTNKDGSLNDTFYGAYYYVVRTIKDRYPNAAMILVTPHHFSYKDDDRDTTKEYNVSTFNSNGTLVEAKSATGSTLSERIQAIKDVGAFFGVPVVDMRAISTIQPIYESNANLLTQDGLHLNDYGGERYAKILKNQIELLLNYYPLSE